MSFQAMAWASGTREAPMVWGGPSARAAILAIANHANDEWFCWAKQSTLAGESEQSPDSIQRRVQEFISLGRVRRIKLKRFGRRTHDFLILKPSPYFEAPIEQIEPFLPRGCDIMAEDSAAADCGSVDSHEVAAAQDDSEINAAAGCGSASEPTLPQPAAHAAALVRQQEPLLEPKEDSPRSPPSGGDDAADQGSGSEGRDWPHLATWTRFEVAWQQPILRQRLCRDLWAGLTEAEREQAITAAQGYVAWRNAQRKPPNPVNAERFLRERDAWARFAALAPKPRTADPPPPPRISIAADGAEYVALQLACHIAGIEPPKPGDDGMVAFIGEIPHGAHAMAMLAGPDVTWVIHDKNSAQFKAWRHRVHEWTGRWIDHKRLWLDEQGNVVASAAEAFKPPGALVPRAIDGLRVPATATGFPPAKGGDPPREENESAA
jgi:hypothetical protein